jgi:hypothetical protein
MMTIDERAAETERARTLSIDEEAVKAKLNEMAKSSKIAKDAQTLIGVLEARVESVLLTSNDELTQAGHELEDWRKMVTAIEALVEERLTQAYITRDIARMSFLEELAADIKKTKADWS